jgi:general L-amino acid transport system permease protein
MTVYVEIFRNIPLLLWLLIIFVPMSELAPPPAAFRVTDEMIAKGEKPAASMMGFGTVAITASGISGPKPVFSCAMPEGSDTPCPAAAVGLGALTGGQVFLILAVILGLSIYVQRRLVRTARAVQEATGVRPTTWWKSALIVLAPVAVASWALGFHLEIPKLTRFDFVGGIQVAHSFTALLIGLSLYTGAFIAEAVRAGILAISHGQSEAAFALGLRPGRTMNLIILPQALRVIIPPLISQYLNLTKNSSLGIAVSYLDLRGTLGGITLNQTGRELECMLLMMAIYLTISLTISAVLNYYNTSVQLKSR